MTTTRTRRTQPETAILALDLSLAATGFCRDGRCGRIATRLRGWERVAHIVRTVRDLAAGARLVVLEGYSFGSRGRAVYQIAELGGIVRFDLHCAGLPFVDVPPGTLKKYAAGKGNAPKDAMIAAAIRRFGFEGCDNNEADAFLLWCLARHAYGEPVASVPKPQAVVVDTVAWPVLSSSSTGVARGHSLRAIAGAVGVGVKTVHQDLAGVPPGTPATVTGRDGNALTTEQGLALERRVIAPHVGARHAPAASASTNASTTKSVP